ncbi:MAG: ATP-binding protein [Gammaproteobacteria bacterium]|nr:ATP-binding protein [Gammaproteobacteria bacterium]
MSTQIVDVTLHIDEETSHEQRESLRDKLLQCNGVAAAAYHDEKPHLMVVEYNPESANSSDFLDIAKGLGLHAELIGL